MHSDKPVIYKPSGNGVFCHIPISFTDEEAEHWINKEKPLGDMLWKRAPLAIDGTPSRIECPSGQGSHILFTMDGKPYVGGDDEGGGHAAHGLPPELLEALGGREGGIKILAMGNGSGDVKQLIEALLGGEVSREKERLMEKLHSVADLIPRPASCHINVPGYGAGSLLNFKPELGRKNREFMQELMRGPSVLTPLDREIIACHVSLANNAKYCYLAHRAVAVALAGGEDAFALHALNDKFKALGAFVIGVIERVNMPTAFIDKVRKAGWNDEALHDAALVASAFCMMNTYVEGLAAVTPPEGDPAYVAVGERLSQRGYTATS